MGLQLTILRRSFARFTRCFVGLVSSVLLLAGQPAMSAEIQPLPKLGAAQNSVSVSGISSGAYMAGQFQMAHAKKVIGAAIIAGGPYGCARSAFGAVTFGVGREIANLSKAVSGCMLNHYAIWGVPNVPRLARQAELLAEGQKIDPLAGVRADKVYLFSGKMDRTVVPAVVSSARDYYLKLGVPEANIKFVANYPAGHAFVTEDAGGSCTVSAKPFVVDCDYDQAGDLLAHIYGPLKPRSAEPKGRYLAFDQRPFSNGSGGGFADLGQVYVPDSCMTATGCRVHVAFHGCAQNKKQVGNAFIEGSGFARWADSNRLVILFPQVNAGPGNAQACWDWWGYTGDNFLTRDGRQIQTVNRMLEHLSATP